MTKHNALSTFGRSGNPMFRANSFQEDAQFKDLPISEKMTLAGSDNKTATLLIL